MRAAKATERPHAFFVLFCHPTRGPLLGSITVPASSRGTWRVQWDIGTIDRDPKLSDHWFCRDEYEREFIQLLRWAVQKADPPSLEVPCATLRWGSAKGMRREFAVDFAHHLLALWEQILTDWEARPAC